MKIGEKTMATTIHRQTNITIDGLGAKMFWKTSGLVALMHLLMAVSDIVVTVT